MNFRSGAILAAIAIVVVAPELRAQPRIQQELVVLASQPSVYMVRVYGDFDLSYPKTVTVDAAQLKQDVAAARAAGAIQRGRNDAQQAWVLLATNLGKYLSCSQETLTASLKDSPYTSGTAFAVGSNSSLWRSGGLG